MQIIETTHGPMEAALLRRVDSVVEDDNERTQAVEYYLGDELVHRSVHIHLKQLPGADFSTALLG